MRAAPPVAVSPAERRVLARWAAPGVAPHRRTQRARIVLAAAAGRTNVAIAAELGSTPETVARWRERFRAAGLRGLEREAPRAGARVRIPKELVEQVLRSTLDGHAPDGGDWSTRSLARELRTNHMTVHRIWRTYGLGPGGPPGDPAGSGPTRVDVVGVFRGAGVSAVVFERDPSARGRVPSAELPDPEQVFARLSPLLETGAGRRRSAGGAVGRGAPDLLVFLREIERRTRPSSRLDAIFDCPLPALGGRVAGWIEAHPRYRVFTTETKDAWVRSTEVWLRRWQNVPLHPASFRGVGTLPRPAMARAVGRRPP